MLGGIAFIISATLKRLNQSTAKEYSIALEAESSVEVMPDSVILELARVENLEKSLDHGVAAVVSTRDRLLPKLQSPYEWMPLTTDFKTMRNRSGIARAYEATGTIFVKVSDFTRVPSIIAGALEAGINSISAANFILSPDLRLRAQKEARAKAYVILKQRSEGLSKDFELNANIEIPSGAAVESNGMTSSSDGLGGATSKDDGSIHDGDIVNIASLIRDLNQMIVPEPKYAQDITVAKVLEVKPIQVTERVRLYFKFK